MNEKDAALAEWWARQPNPFGVDRKPGPTWFHLVFGPSMVLQVPNKWWETQN